MIYRANIRLTRRLKNSRNSKKRISLTIKQASLLKVCCFKCICDTMRTVQSLKGDTIDMLSKLLSFSFVVLLLGQWSFCADEPRVMVTGIYVMQPSAPLQITRISKTLDDQLAEVTVTNRSQKIVTGFKLGWTVGIPQPCSATLARAEISSRTAPADRAVLNPGESVTTKAYRLSTADMVTTTKQLNAVLADVQTAVVEVTFSDGSSWNASFPEGGMFDASEFQFQTNKCSGGKLAA